LRLDGSMLTINEIYLSIQGESTYAGRPCAFVRLTACDLRCSWCDTPYAFTEGRKMTLDEVTADVGRLGCELVEITGGEPLLQKETITLMERLLAERRTVLLETGGHISIAAVPRAVVKIVDVKCPGSGEADRHHWPNMDLLAPHDEVKFVIADRIDYEYARDVTSRFTLADRVAAVLYSPAHGVLDPRQLSAWILEDHLPVRLQLQLHKYIWGAHVKGV
jgi:7-carboxy-7-deazaguanine synthase